MYPPRPCSYCGRIVTYSGRGRPRLWCSDHCRKRAHDAGQRVETVVVEVVRVEQVDPQRLVERMLEHPATTAQLLQATARHWRTREVPGGDAGRLTLAPLLEEMWQTFHAEDDPTEGVPPPAKPTSAAAEYRAAVDKVMSSPRSIAEVLTRVKTMLDNDELSDAKRHQPVYAAIVGLTGWLHRYQ